MLVVLVLLVLPLLAEGATQPGAVERLSSREVLARARERMAGAELGSLMTKTTARKGPAKPTTTAVQSREDDDDDDDGGAEAKEEVVPEVDMNANTAKVMFETIRRMNPGLAPLREQLPGQQQPQQQHQHKNSLGSKVKAALGGTSVTRRVNKKPLPALGRHAYSSSSSDHLRKLLGDNDPQQQQPPQQVAPTTLTVDPGVPAEPTVQEADTSVKEQELQQAQAAGARENSALHALLQEIELNEEHRHTNSEEEQQPRFTEGTQSHPLHLPLHLLPLEWLTEMEICTSPVFGEPSGEEEEEAGRRGDDGEPKGIHNEELTLSAPPSAQRSAAERAEEAALLERLMEAYAAYAALRKEPPPFAFGVPTDLGQMPTNPDRLRVPAEERDPRQLQRGGVPTHDHSSSSSSQHLAVLPAAAELSPEPLLT